MSNADHYQFDSFGALLNTNLPWPSRRGKVRDVYDLGDRLLIVSTDRISAYDWILPVGIPDRGRVLTQMSTFWFERLDVPHHLLSSEVAEATGELDIDPVPLAGRVMVTQKAEVIPFECVVRGYLEGSGWREYQQNQVVCGISLPAGMQQCSQLPEPIFTPATKAESGHDENVSFETMAAAIGDELANRLRDQSLEVYRAASAIASNAGILIADTKLEWGVAEGRVILIDEVLTPDSSRFWPADDYQPGRSQHSFDKQFVREWLDRSGWDKNSSPPALPEDTVRQTRQRYLEALRRITGRELES